MRQSQLFTKTIKETPKDEVSINAQLLIRGGFIHKEMAGVYSYLPLGLRVFKKIEQIIREEMNGIGGQEVVMTALQEKALWEKTERWDDEKVDVWFKTKLKNNTELGLAWTNEEQVATIAKEFVHSYRDLPISLYQFMTKFRNETRAKSGIMRTREFVMKDMYSFSKNEDEHNAYYDRVTEAYKKIFKRVGIGDLTYLTFASGGAFSKYSHEFQTVTSAGEDTIYVDEHKGVAVNKEVLNDEVLAILGTTREQLVEQTSIEVGNIFTLGERFSQPLELTYQTESGESRNAFMGCYGIGPGRLMGTIVEVLADDRGIIWPASVAPYAVHLVSLCKDAGLVARADEVYERLCAAGIEVLYDDRPDIRAGEKFADSDLIGIPVRMVVSEKTLEDDMVEVKRRASQDVELVSLDQYIEQHM